MANEFVIKNGLIIGGGGLQMSGSLAITGSLNVSSVVNAGTDTDKFLVLDASNNVDFRTGAQVLSDIGGLEKSGSIAITGSLNISSVVNAGTDTDKFLVLDTNGNVDFRTGAEILSDIGAAASSIKNYIDFNNLVDFKTLTQGFAPMCGITDVQEGDNSPFSNWLAPSDGYIERIELMVGETNTVSGSFSIRAYKNGSTLGVAQTNAQSSVRTVTEYVYGPTFSFSKRDRLAFFMDKTTNTSDLYTFNIYFQVGN